MVPRFVTFFALMMVLLPALDSMAQQNANGQPDANTNENVLKQMQQQLQQMQRVVGQLQAENQKLRQALQNQAQNHGSQSGGYTNIFEADSPHIEFYPPAGASPPSWIDTVIEANRQRQLEDWAQQRANERLVDRRILQIRAESRAIGARYAPRPLREAVLAGADPKETRDQMVTDRTDDFNQIINQPSVQEFLKFKVALIEHGAASMARTAMANGYIADANVIMLAERIKRDVDDARILYGNTGGFQMAVDLTREQRGSANVEVSGPTRDTIAQGRRQSAVDIANSTGTDLDQVLRQQAVAKMQKLRAAASAASVYDHDDVNMLNSAINGKFSRTSVPHVQSAPQPNVPRN